MRRSLQKSILTKSDLLKSVAVFLIGGIMLAWVVMSNGCAMVEGAKGWSEMSPKEQATMVSGVYVKQYDLYLREAVAPDLTEDKREILRAKKALADLYPYLSIYNEYAARGQFAPADVEVVVMRLMDRLLGI